MNHPRPHLSRRIALVAASALLVIAAACTTDEELQRDDTKVTPEESAPESAPSPSATTTEAPAPAASEGAAPAATTKEEGPAGSRQKLAEGARCASRDDCASGICEGEGCGDDALGVCAPRERMCTKDLRPYCGCDGKTFSSSGGCPMNRYAHRGRCEPTDAAPAAGKAALGDACLAGSDCASGLCEGQGCGDDAPGVCVDHARHCTRDLVAYCGCDGTTFKASGACAVRRFAHKGACKGSR